MSEPARSLDSALPRGLNVVGHLTGNMGLAVAARNTLAMLVARDEPFSAIDVDPGGGRQGADCTYAHLLAEPPTAPYPVNLFQLNPPEVIDLVRRAPAWLDLAGKTNAVVPFWELPRLPVSPDWAGLVAAMDVVLAPSRFIADAVTRSAPGTTVVHYPQTVFLPAGISTNRRDFGLPEDAVLFYMSIDVTSDLSRKNPADAIEAFRLAFGGDQRAHLVVKLGNLRSGHPWADATALVQEIASMPNATAIDRDLSYAEALSLSAACDAYVSLHRSEGLGLNLLEAMSLGKPVIATAWSGNMDFMAEEDSCLVGYELVSVRASHPAYQPKIIGPDQSWAQPDVNEATNWMRRLADDASLRDTIGAAARASAEAGRKRFLEGRVLSDLEAKAITLRTNHDPAARNGRWKPFRHVPAGARARRLAVRVARRLGFRRGA